MRVCVVHVFRVPIVLHRVAVKAGEFNARRSGRSGGENRRGESAERESEEDFESSVYPIFLEALVLTPQWGIGRRLPPSRWPRIKTRTELPSSDNRARVLYEFSDWEDFGVEN